MVNLCGVGVGDKRWSGAFKQSLRDSRIDPTEVISAAVVDAGVPTLINASAVGYYGDTRSRIVDETAPAGTGFLAQLCVDWEAATAPADDAGVRVVLARTGLVLSPAGGVLGKLKPLFAFGLGGRLGGGRQYMPWISLEDEVRAPAVRHQQRRPLRPGELHRTGAGDQLRVHRGTGPGAQPAHAVAGSRFRAARPCSGSSPRRAFSAASGPSRPPWNAPVSCSTTTPSARRLAYATASARG